MARHEALSDEDRQIITKEVTDFLAARGLRVTQLARRAGLVQPFVWSVANGRFVKMTPRLRHLLQYVRMKNDAEDPEVQGVHDAIDRFLASGGDLRVLKSSIEILAAAYEGRP